MKRPVWRERMAGRSIARSRGPVALAIALLAGLVACGMPGSLVAGRSAAPAPSPLQPLALGAYVHGAPWDPALLDAFAARLGRMPAVVLWYQDWVHSGGRWFDSAKLEAVAARGAMPMISWEPWDDSGGVDQPAFALRTIVAGEHDDLIREWARAAAAWGGPFYLRFAHEMNGDWYPWAVGVNGNTAAGYVAAWRRVVGLFREAGATNVRWVWCANRLYPGGRAFEDLYPGDDWVDWVALDGYNRDHTDGERWESVGDLFDSSYAALTVMTAKPLMIAETASGELGGDKAAWITRGLLHDVPERLPRVRAVIWFDHAKGSDWRLDSSAAALAAFREVATAPLYAGTLP